MKLEDIEKLCNEATEACFTFKASNAQYEFYKSCHEIVPKLIAVAEAAKATLARQNDYQASWAMEDIRIALEELEKE